MQETYSSASPLSLPQPQLPRALQSRSPNVSPQRHCTALPQSKDYRAGGGWTSSSTPVSDVHRATCHVCALILPQTSFPCLVGYRNIHHVLQRPARRSPAGLYGAREGGQQTARPAPRQLLLSSTGRILMEANLQGREKKKKKITESWQVLKAMTLMEQTEIVPVQRNVSVVRDQFGSLT